VESILRRWSYQGETTLPDDEAALYRVAVRCGFADASQLLSAVGKFREAIRKAFLSYFPGI
jgi:glutamine synthetase adenylyltransferase